MTLFPLLLYILKPQKRIFSLLYINLKFLIFVNYDLFLIFEVCLKFWDSFKKELSVVLLYTAKSSKQQVDLLIVN